MSDSDLLGPARDAARAALRSRMEERGWGALQLSERAGVSYNAVNEFLAGRRDWPRPSTRAKMETALGWEPGELARIARAAVIAAGNSDISRSPEMGTVARLHSDTKPQVVLEFPPGSLDGLTKAEVREVSAAAELAALQRMREILAARREGGGDERRAPDRPYRPKRASPPG